MSTKTKTAKNSEERIDMIVGIITVAVVLALVAWFFIAMSARGNAITALAYSEEIRRGDEQTFTANVQNAKIKNGEKVRWTVNNEVVAETTYQKGQPLTLTYAPKVSGANYISVKVGKYTRTANVEVLPPVLTIAAPNIVMTYGEEMPDLKYDCSGFVDGDCADMLEYDGTYYVCDENDVQLPCATNEATTSNNRLNVGVYKLNMEQNCCFKDYETNYVGGTLTVLPKTIFAKGNFDKVYDSSNYIENPEIELVGVESGDEVCADCDKLYFDNKNAGTNKTVMLSNVELTGADKCNYVLESTAYGKITPKQLEINGLKVRNKQYDGTTRAQIEKMGALSGVIDGDSVAIGSLEMSFAEAKAGEQQLVLDNVTLIGADKDNYVVRGVDVETANINTTLWNRIFVKNPAITAGME